MKADKDETGLVAYIDKCRTLVGLTLREAFEKLREDFPQSAIKERVGSGGSLSSISAAYRTERINEVFGLCGLGWDFGHDGIEVLDNDRVVRVWFRFAYVSQNGGEPELKWSEKIHSHGMGNVHKGMTDGDARKSAVTDGLTKAVSMLGVGIAVFKGEQTHNKKPPARKPNPQQKADAESKNPPPRNNHTPEDKTGRRMNEGYKGNPEDQTVTIPAKFKTKPKTGKSLGYEIDGKVIFFPIGHVKSQTADEVEVTAWVADQKIDQGEIAPELVCYGDSPVSDANEDA